MVESAVPKRGFCGFTLPNPIITTVNQTIGRAFQTNLPNVMAFGETFRIFAAYRDTLGRIALDEAPTLHIFRIDEFGAEVEELASAPMVDAGTGLVWRTDWTPSARAVFTVQLRGLLDEDPIIRDINVTVMERYDQALLARNGILADRVGIREE
jgi:hypothetical protein